MATMMVHSQVSIRNLSLALVVLIVYFQYSVSVLATCSTDRPSSEDLHRIPTSTSPSNGESNWDGGEAMFDVFHRHHPNMQRAQSPHEEGHGSLIQHSLKRGVLREESLNRAIKEERMRWRSMTTADERNRRNLVAGETQTVVAAGGEYIVKMQIGTPPKPVLLILDTGSGLTWVQCKQCVQCSPQLEPPFDPSTSSSYSRITCQSPSCLKASSQFQCNTLNNTCEYGVQYGQSSFSTGIVSKDRLQWSNGSMTVWDFLFGCGLFNMGDFTGNSGLLGLSRSNISFPSQLRTHHPNLGRKFTLCFADLAHNLTAKGFIAFGNSSALSQNVTGHHRHDDQRKQLYTPFMATPFPTQFYYLGLRGISVDGTLLPIPSSVFELDHEGNGGTVIDSGTTLTLLNPMAYGMLRDAFRSAGEVRRKLRKVAAVGFNSTGHVIDTCYQFDHRRGLNQSSSLAEELVLAVPSVALHFVGDVELVLPPDNVLFPFEDGVCCLAFASTQSDLGINVIGNIQQQNLRIEYDLENSRMGFESVVSCAH